MYSSSQLAARFIRYYLTAANGKGHGIHSPFVFDFVTRVLNDKTKYPAYNRIEHLRQQLLHNNSVLEVADFGAGSVTGTRKERTVAAIARSAAKPKKLSQLLFRIAHYYQPATIIELGTSLGLSAAYLASGHTAACVITCEGAAAVASIARENFALLNINNVTVTEGIFDDTLPLVLHNTASVQLAFIDGNHRKAPTERYFEQLLQKIYSPGIMVLDDIHWSAEMEAAWETVKAHPAVMLSIDLFFIGIVFFNKGLKVKQHFVIRF